jgi:hypothetical protein
MDSIKCAGHNTEKLPFDQFYNLFIQECNSLGMIINTARVNQDVLFATVIPR